jgi:hypothetical protein
VPQPNAPPRTPNTLQAVNILHKKYANAESRGTRNEYGKYIGELEDIQKIFNN